MVTTPSNRTTATTTSLTAIIFPSSTNFCSFSATLTQPFSKKLHQQAKESIMSKCPIAIFNCLISLKVSSPVPWKSDTSHPQTQVLIASAYLFLTHGRHHGQEDVLSFIKSSLDLYNSVWSAGELTNASSEMSLS